MKLDDPENDIIIIKDLERCFRYTVTNNYSFVYTDEVPILTRIHIPYVDNPCEYFEILIHGDFDVPETEANRFLYLWHQTQFYVDYAANITNDRKDLYYYTPVELIESSKVCNMLEDLATTSEYADIKGVTNLFSSNVSTHAKAILQCTKDNQYLEPIITTHVKSNSALKADYKFFKTVLLSILRHNFPYTQVNNSLPTSLTGNQVLFIGTSYENIYLSNSTFSQKKFKFFGVDIYRYDNFHHNYWDGYTYYTGSKLNVLNLPRYSEKVDADSVLRRERRSYDLPGIYLAAATEYYEFEQIFENLENVLDVASIASGYGGLSVAAKAARVNKVLFTAGVATTTFASAEIASGIGHLLLSEAEFCDETSENYVGQEFCEKYNRFLLVVDLICILDIAVPSQKVLKKALDEEYIKLVDEQNQGAKFENSMTPEEYDGFDDLLRAATTNFTKFEDHFPKIRDYAPSGTPPDLLWRIYNHDKLKDYTNVLLGLKTEINALDGNVGFQFMKDILETTNDVNKIGYDLTKLNGGMVDAWKVLDDVGDARKLNLVELEKITEYTDAFPSGLVKDEIEELGSYDNWLDRKYVLVDDTWRLFDPVGSSGTVYNNTKGLEEIYISGSLSDFESGVTYLDATQRQVHEVFVQHDRIVDASGNLIDTRNSVSILADGTEEVSNSAIFVMSQDGKFYISKQDQYGVFHHSSFLSGAEVSAAGEIIVENGIIFSVSNKSGHYLPPLSTVESNVVDELSTRSYFFGHNTSDDISFISE